MTTAATATTTKNSVSEMNVQQEDTQSPESKDEVDFIPVNIKSEKDANHNNIVATATKSATATTATATTPATTTQLPKKPIYGDCEAVTVASGHNNNNNNHHPKKTGLTTLEKFSFFTLNRKKIGDKPEPRHRKHNFVKSASFSRILGNTYNTKKYENELRKFQEQAKTKHVNFVHQERFYKRGENGIASCEPVSLADFQETNSSHSHDLGTKAFRTISRGIGKLWWKRSHSVEISSPDPEYKVSYLGNVLTGWAKGEGCVEKPLNTLWRNYTQNNKPDVVMRVVVCASGLKATTRQHGLTEYWANRITHCCAPKNFPRVFCWIYRHEGRKMKHELRCHAVLCSKESIAQDICNTLRENLDQALRDFKREKILKQNARLSLANSADENPSLPKRKILLSVGGNNYRPPLERSKSAPKLMAIEEAVGEEDGEDIEDTNEPEMPACCQKDSLYPAMTLGRRRCRRGHSIRRTGKGWGGSLGRPVKTCGGCSGSDNFKSKSNTSLGSNSDEDELDKVLSFHDYNTNSPLAGELLSYFDMKLHKTSSLSDLVEEQGQNSVNNHCDIDDEHINTDPSPKLRAALSLDVLDDDGASHAEEIPRELSELEDFENDELYFRQAAILNLLHRSSLRKMANLSMSSDEGSVKAQSPPITSHQISLDSDEGSISSGCETASTVTTKEQESVTPPPKTFVKSIKFNLKEEIIPVARHEDGSDSDESGYVEFPETRKNEGILV